MAKSILISIKPRYVADILNHKKTIEVRKSMPKCDLPIDVYIYCTKDKEYLYKHFSGYYNIQKEYNKLCSHNGKVVAKFTLDELTGYKIHPNEINNPNDEDWEIAKASCLSFEEIIKYANGKPIIAWHISNLKIFDKPKELSEFYLYCKDKKCEYRKNHCSICYREPLTKAPQSWCYVEVE